MKQRVINATAYSITLVVLMVIGALIFNSVCPAYQ